MFKIDSRNILRVLMIGLGVVLLVLALVIAGSRVASHDANQVKTEEVNYNFEYTIDNESITTVFNALKKYSEDSKFDLQYNNNYSFGVFIESIAGVKNGDDGKYWQYYVNDKLGEVAADKKEVKAGDKVEWRFEDVLEI